MAVIASWEHLPTRLRMAAPLSDDVLYDLCLKNPGHRIERSADGELVVMPPAGGDTGLRSARLLAQLVMWADREGTGFTFDSSTGFVLPDRAARAPDAAWVHKERWNALSPEQRKKLVPLCPDFVIELMSPSDDLDEVRAKMDEYIANGAELGWLIDPERKQVHVYRAARNPQILDAPMALEGEGALATLRLDLRLIW